jgi:hypothetical protein
MTRDEVTSLVKALGDVMRVLKDADPADKAEIYGQLGLTLTYHPNEKRVVAEARPASMYLTASLRLVTPDLYAMTRAWRGNPMIVGLAVHLGSGLDGRSP